MKSQRIEETVDAKTIERGVNSCLHILGYTMGLSPLAMVSILQEAAAFVSKQAGIMGAGTPFNKDTGEAIQGHARPPGGREL